MRGAVPLGGALAGGVLAAFGANRVPAPRQLAGLLLVAALLGTLVLLRARRAYTQALARSLGEGRLSLDVPREQAAALRSGLRSMLREAGQAGEIARALQILSLLGNDVTREDVQELLSHAPPSADPALERQVLAAARLIGLPMNPARLDHALERTKADASAPGAALRFEAPGPAGLASEDGRLQLQAAVEDGLQSPQGHVFAAAAATAMSADSSAYVDRLVAQLVRGPHFADAGRALAMAGESAMGPVSAVLPSAGPWAAECWRTWGRARASRCSNARRSSMHRTRTAAARRSPSYRRLAVAWNGGARIMNRAIDATLGAAESPSHPRSSPRPLAHPGA